MRTWTDERDAVLRSLWERGLTSREIAAEMGSTRNAVIGRAHRLNCSGRPNLIKTDGESPEAKAERNRRRRVKRQAAQKPRPKLKPPAPAKAARPKAIPVAAGKRAAIARTAYPAPASYRGPKCQWIPGEPSADDACKCGGPALPERPYCSRHEAIAVVHASERAQELRAFKAAAA